MNQTCFVISPIGSDGSETRQIADDFMNYLVEPAIEIYGFDIIRADKIPHASTITSDIIRLVQEADICIVDITGGNPNVFYELGRRHETGRPFVQLRNKSDESPIPFDVSGIRTLTYDLSSLASSRKSVQELRGFVQEIVKHGFQSAAAGYTLASIGDAISRMERKINEQQVSTSKRIKTHAEIDPLELLAMHPVEAYKELVARRDLDGAFEQLQRVKVSAGIGNYVAGLAFLASGQHEPSGDELQRIIKDVSDGDDSTASMLGTAVESAFQGYKDFSVHTGRAQQGRQFMEDAFSKIRNLNKFDDKTIARLANLVGMLLWQLKEHEAETWYEAIATSLDPEVPSYFYNACLTQDALGNNKKLAEYLQQLVSLESTDEDHLRLIAKHRHLLDSSEG